MSEQFLIEKRGLYYRPESAGYTGLKRDAGRYSFEEAAVHAGPNGPDGSQDGIGIWEEAEAPEFSTACPWDVRLVEKTRKDTLREAAAECERENQRRLALASIRIPAGWWEVRDAILKLIDHPTPNSN